MDPKLQLSLTEGLSGGADAVMDLGIRASGKLHLLEKLLSELKNQERKVLILFQVRYFVNYMIFCCIAIQLFADYALFPIRYLWYFTIFDYKLQTGSAKLNCFLVKLVAQREIKWMELLCEVLM